MTANEKRRRLVESVVLLASGAAEQQQVLPEWVVRADEIALIFDECYQYVGELAQQDRLNDRQIEVLRSIGQRLEAMSGQSQAALWTDQALAADSNWQWIRQRARDALELLGTKPHTPQLDWVTFVR